MPLEEGQLYFLFESLRISLFSEKYTEKCIIFIIPDLGSEFTE